MGQARCVRTAQPAASEGLPDRDHSAGATSRRINAITAQPAAANALSYGLQSIDTDFRQTRKHTARDHKTAEHRLQQQSQKCEHPTHQSPTYLRCVIPAIQPSSARSSRCHNGVERSKFEHLRRVASQLQNAPSRAVTCLRLSLTRTPGIVIS